MKRIVLPLAILFLFSPIGLATVGCELAEIYEKYWHNTDMKGLEAIDVETMAGRVKLMRALEKLPPEMIDSLRESMPECKQWVSMAGSSEKRALELFTFADQRMRAGPPGVGYLRDSLIALRTKRELNKTPMTLPPDIIGYTTYDSATIKGRVATLNALSAAPEPVFDRLVASLKGADKYVASSGAVALRTADLMNYSQNVGGPGLSGLQRGLQSAYLEIFLESISPQRWHVLRTELPTDCPVKNTDQLSQVESKMLISWSVGRPGGIAALVQLLQ